MTKEKPDAEGEAGILASAEVRGRTKEPSSGQAADHKEEAQDKTHHSEVDGFTKQPSGAKTGDDSGQDRKPWSPSEQKRQKQEDSEGTDDQGSSNQEPSRLRGLFAWFRALKAAYLALEPAAQAKVIAEGILVVVAVSGGLLVYRQSQQTEEQLKLARESNSLLRDQIQKGQRAYLKVHDPRLDKPLAVGEEPHVTLELTNNGETPALEVFYGQALIIAPDCHAEVQFADLRPAPPIAAGETTKIYFSLLSKLTPFEFQDITAKGYSLTVDGLGPVQTQTLTITPKPRLYLRAIVQYRDVFDGAGETEFSAVWNAEKNVFATCPTHNTLK